MASSLSEQALNGDKQALAKLVTKVENRKLDREEASRLYGAHTGEAYVIGITGPPGAGKSTLVNGLIKEYQKQGKKIGVLAVDPSSVLTGGAVLGDRVRMREGGDTSKVFIRSLATRGSLGGLTDTIEELIALLDACGKEIIILETVGVGQAETKVAQTAHTTVLVTVPGLGDEIQAMKAGLLEMSHIIVVNKADKPEAETTAMELELGTGTIQRAGWCPRILKTIAVAEVGVEEVVQAMEDHRQHLKNTGMWRMRLTGKTRQILLDLIQQQLIDDFLSKPQVAESFDSLVHDVADRKIELSEAMAKLLAAR